MNKMLLKAKDTKEDFSKEANGPDNKIMEGIHTFVNIKTCCFKKKGLKM